MCRAQADGGARCASHLKQGVEKGVTSFGAAVTGLSPKETAAAVEDLRREGADLADPTREAVDSFLEEQAFRVHHEPNLSEVRRTSIGDRIKAPIGRILPDRATFHARKNVVAEAWARSPRKVAAVFMAGALSFGVGACGTTSGDAPQPSHSRPVANAPATPGYSTQVSIEKPTISPDAVRVFGRARAEAGAKAVTDFATKFTYQEDLIRVKTKYTAADFARPREYMTPDMRASWDDTVRRSLSGDDKADGSVQALTFHDVRNVGYRPSGPMVVNQTIRNIKVGTEMNVKTGKDRLSVTFTQRAELRLTAKGSPTRFPLFKTSTLWLEPGPKGLGHAWLVDGYSSIYESDAPVPDPAGM
jgi:hypothetical protein